MISAEGIAACINKLKSCGMLDSIVVEFCNDVSSFSATAVRNNEYFKGLDRRTDAGYARVPVEAINTYGGHIIATCTVHYEDFGDSRRPNGMTLRAATLMASDNTPLCTVIFGAPQDMHPGICFVVDVKMNIGDVQ